MPQIKLRYDLMFLQNCRCLSVSKQNESVSMFEYKHQVMQRNGRITVTNYRYAINGCADAKW